MEQLIQLIKNFFISIGLSENGAEYAVEAAMTLAFIGLSVLVYFVVKSLINLILKKIALKTKGKWFKELSDGKTAQRIVLLIISAVLYRLTVFTPLIKGFMDVFYLLFIILMSVSVIFAVLDSVNKVYDRYYPGSKARPIKGVFSAIKIILVAIALVIGLSAVSGQSPVYIISGLGALSAVAMLVFKDSILGFVAGFQMQANDLVRIGDWVEMDKLGADGEVIDITLTFVKVKNWDNTIVTIPAYSMVSDSFINWRGMTASGGRRIKRAVYIDVESVGFCSDELLERLSGIELIKDYVKDRQKEIQAFNSEKKVDTSLPVNGRHMTNIGTFRRYALEYLKHNMHIHQGMTLLVRQLQTGSTGIPIEIYAFTNDTAWEHYEDIMSDIFDHLYAAVPYFNLKVYQQPSGADIRSLKGHL